jgi:hypothetical protein
MIFMDEVAVPEENMLPKVRDRQYVVSICIKPSLSIVHFIKPTPMLYLLIKPILSMLCMCIKPSR